MQTEANRLNTIADEVAAQSDALVSSRIKDMDATEIEQVAGGIYAEELA